MSTELIGFARASDSDFEELRIKAETAAAENSGYVFSQCKLLPGCSPLKADIGFGYLTGTQSYVVYVKPPVNYVGNNTAANQLFKNGSVFYSSFEQLKGFIRSLNTSEPCCSVIQPQQQTDTEASLPHTDTQNISVRDNDIPKNIVIPADVFERDCTKKISGQSKAVWATSLMVTNFLGKLYPKRPLSLLFYGPTGVGKTELAKTLCGVINKHADSDMRYDLQIEDLSQYQQEHSAYRLIGAPPGYVGYGDPTVFDKTFENPQQIFVFDELDKAHPNVIKVLMRALDEGKHTRNPTEGNEANFYDLRKCILIFTSNIDLDIKRGVGFYSAPISETDAGEMPLDTDACGMSTEDLIRVIVSNNEIARTALIQKGYRPEVAGRIGGFIPFVKLEGSSKIEITVKSIGECAMEYGFKIHHISSEIVQFILDEYTTSAGARAFHSLVDLYLGVHFAQHAAGLAGKTVNLEGTVFAPEFEEADEQ